MRKRKVDSRCVHEVGKLEMPGGCGQCLAALKLERDEFRTLFDLQHSRVIKAIKLWRKAHPGNELVSPDLGDLVQWLMDQAKGGTVEDKGQLAPKYTLQQADLDAKTRPFRDLISSEAKSCGAGVCSRWNEAHGWWEFKLTAPLEGIEIQVAEDASEVRFLAKGTLLRRAKTLAGVRNAFSKVVVTRL